MTFERWEQRWDMSFNPSECQVLHITRAKCPIQTRYILHSTVLESVTSAKYLGITISDNLSWTPHIDSVSKKANQTLGFFKRNIKVHNKDLKSQPVQHECGRSWNMLQQCGPRIQQQILQNLKLYSAGQPAGLPVTTSAPLV